MSPKTSSTKDVLLLESNSIITLSVDVDHHQQPQPQRDTSIIASFIPPLSPSPVSPILFRDDDDNNNNNSDDNRDEEPTLPLSIMRQQNQKLKRHEESEEIQADLKPDREHSENARVATLEERVRDLEEKLSTLSMLWLQSQRKSPTIHRQQQQESLNDPPISTALEDTSSTPSSPFRSLSSYSNMPSSTAPVLESPTPITTGMRTLQYEEHLLRNKSMRNNLSFQILHAPNGTLDLSSCSNLDVDTGSNINDQSKLSDAMLRIPSLDSLPGSERTSPVIPLLPIISANLTQDASFSSSEDKANCSNVSNADNNHYTVDLKVLSPPSIDESSIRRDDDQKYKEGNVANISSILDKNCSSITKVEGNGGSKVDHINFPKPKKKKSNIKSKWLDYLNSVQESQADTDKQMEEFVKVPSAVEALLSFGFWISVDSFLYTLTVLPIRFAWSILLLLRLVFDKVMNFLCGNSKIGDSDDSPGPFQFHRRHSYQLIQVSIIYIIYEYVLKPIDVSIIYHWIRVQSMVKLYLLVAIVEVFDRLMCSLGQDCLDSLYWNTTRRPRSSRLIVSALVVLTYTALHSFLLFVHLATLNVAMNSSDQALLSLLIGGNFAEIKSTVFKKYNRASLFKIAASDVCERFKLALFLLLVLMLNASQGMDKKMLYSYLSQCGIVWCAEWLSDWLKHAFITKFNFIASGVYGEYGLLLAGDVSGFQHEGDNLDHSHAVVKRLGLAQIPLVCVMTKYLKEVYKYATYESQPQTWIIVMGVFVSWFFLFLTKLSLGSFLHRLARRKLEAAPEFCKNNATVAKKKN